MKKNRLRNSLKFSFLDGVFASAMFGFTMNFWVACAEAAKVTALKAGLVSTIPQLAASLIQPFAEPITNKSGGRLKTLKIFVASQWIFLSPLILLPVVPGPWRYALLLACALLSSALGSLAGPPWFSMMSDHLPFRSRGKYFGWRSRIMESLMMGFGLLAGLILQFFHKSVFWGFSIIFGLAALSRFFSWIFLIKMYDPPIKREMIRDTASEKDIPESFLKFLGNGLKNNFVCFCFFSASFAFSVNLIAPYLAVYMLRELHFSYQTFTYVTFSASLTSIFGVKIWGELADKFGNLRIIRATSMFIAGIPILWFISGEPLWLVATQIAAGFAWSGLQLSILTFAFSAIPSAYRTRAISYLSALNGIATFAGSLIGGKLLNHLPVFHGTQFHLLFIISALMRTFTVLFFLKRLKGDAPVHPISTFSLYINALGLEPMFESGEQILNTFFGRKKP